MTLSLELPATSRELVIREHDRILPTVDGCAPGIVHTADRGRGMTAQCSVCLRTATGHRAADVIMIGAWNFETDTLPDETWPQPGHTRYRRCPDCRAARRHPAETPGG